MADKTPVVPLVLLYTQENNRVDGATRFQKLVFLSQEESDLPETYSYHADKYGPYSHELQSDLDRLIREEFIELNVVNNWAGNPKYVYTLTTKGRQVSKGLLDRAESVFSKIDQATERYSGRNLDDLLSYVYSEYPEYAEETELDVERLHDPEAPSQFLEPGQEEGNVFRYVEQLDATQGVITSTEETFERIILNSLRDQTLFVEQYEGGRISVYWQTECSLQDHLTRLKDDERISLDSPSELRLGSSDEWIRGPLGEVLQEDSLAEECTFLAAGAVESNYEVTWEPLEEESTYEVTILFLPAEDRQEGTIRDVLTNYFGPAIAPGGYADSMDKIESANDDVRTSLWEMTQFVLS